MDGFDRKYDRALSKEALYTIEDKAAMIAKIEDKLKPGGLFLLTEYVISSDAVLGKDRYKEWVVGERQHPYPVLSDELVEMLKKNRLQVRVSEDMCADLEKSTVRLAATNSVSSLWLMPRLRAFHEANCNITIALTSSDVDEECLAEGMDLAILRGEGDWPGFEATQLFGETVFPVCAPGS